MKRISVYISETQIKRLASLSRKTGLSASEMLRRAIDEYWENHKPIRKGGT
jgi:metal-responsive CopG/Arc/MetJ family transcriptional regulator